jgi:putative FmdB family regulatory protein
MPTYDYRCMGCGDDFEHFQTMTSDPLETCSKCGGDLKRLIGAGLGPIFKGSGFYETDYKSKNSSSESTTTKTSEKKKKDTTPTKKVKPAKTK